MMMMKISYALYGDYDAVFDKALSFDREDDLISLYVPPRQESYKKPDNWRERNRIGLTNVKEQLQKCIRNVEQSNSFTLDLEHNSEWTPYHSYRYSFRGQLRDNQEPIAWDEIFLDEYWFDLECSAWTDIRNIQN